MIQIQIILVHMLVLDSLCFRSLSAFVLLVLIGAATETVACSGPTSDEVMSLRCNLEFVAGKVINKNELEALNSKLRRNGYMPLGGSVEPAYVETNVKVTPLLNYDPNINGGNPPKNLVVGDLEFVSDPANFRVAGLTSGLKIHMNGRYANNDGHVIEVKANSSLHHAINFPHLSIRDNNLSLCFSTQISSWNISRICREHLNNKRDVASAKFINTMLGQYVYTTYDDTTFLTSVELVHEDSGYHYDGVKLSHQAVDFNGMGFSTYGTWKRSRLSPGVRERKIGVNKSLDFNVFSAIGLENVYIKHEPFLGTERKDTSWKITTEIQMTNRASLMLGYTKLNSTIDYFDEEYPFLLFQFDS